MNPKMTTTTYKVLEATYENQLTVGETRYCPLSQNALAKIVGCNRMTVNQALKFLGSEGYIICETQQYVLTEKGINTVVKAKEIE